MKDDPSMFRCEELRVRWGKDGPADLWAVISLHLVPLFHRVKKGYELFQGEITFNNLLQLYVPVTSVIQVEQRYREKILGYISPPEGYADALDETPWIQLHDDLPELLSRLPKSNVLRPAMPKDYKTHLSSANKPAKKRQGPKQNEAIKQMLRREAKHKWDSGSKATLKAMAEALRPLAKKRDGSLYTLDFVKDGIRDLNPDKSPGRRPAKKGS